MKTIKTVQIKGTINNLTYTPSESEFSEFKKSMCYIRIENFAYNTQAAINTIVSISCNYATDEKLSGRKQLVSYEVPLQSAQVNFKLFCKIKFSVFLTMAVSKGGLSLLEF